MLLLPGAGVRDRDYFAFRLFAEALGGGMSSRLFQEAREKRGLAYAIDAYAETYEDTGVLGVYAGAAPPTPPSIAAARRRARSARWPTRSTRPSSPAPRPSSRARMFMARESTLARAEQAAGQALLFGRLFTSAELSASIDAVTLDDLRRVGERLLAPGRSAGAVLGAEARAGRRRSV